MGWALGSGRTACVTPAALSAGLIIVNAWYGKFVNDKSRKNERVKVIDVTVPLQCLVKDSKLILTEASKVYNQVTKATCSQDQADWGAAPRDGKVRPAVTISSVWRASVLEPPLLPWALKFTRK